MRPFAGSEYDSDESIGFVGRKTLFNGGMLESEIKEAEAMAEASLEQIKATYRRVLNCSGCNSEYRINGKSDSHCERKCKINFR